MIQILTMCLFLKIIRGIFKSIYSRVSSRSCWKKFKQYTFNTETHLMFIGYLAICHLGQKIRKNKSCLVNSEVQTRSASVNSGFYFQTILTFYTALWKWPVLSFFHRATNRMLLMDSRSKWSVQCLDAWTVLLFPLTQLWSKIQSFQKLWKKGWVVFQLARKSDI